MSRLKRWGHSFLLWLKLLVLSLFLLQVLFIARVALMRWVDPASTSVQRSQVWQVLKASPLDFQWRQQWVALEKIHPDLSRAVIASEDDSFVQHSGVRWDVIEQAWRRNERAQSRSKDPDKAKLVGGSTITQQLAKNLLLSGERNLVRKSEELVLTYALELFLDKRRILEIYLNSVEWGRGTFGAQAAAQRHFGVAARQLDRAQAARLAVLLPRPRNYERFLQGPYVTDRSISLLARMPQVQLP